MAIQALVEDVPEEAGCATVAAAAGPTPPLPCVPADAVVTDAYGPMP